MARDTKEAKIVTIKVPHTGSIVVECGTFSASLRELLVLRSIHSSVSYDEAAVKLSMKRSSVRGNISKVNRRNGFVSDEHNVHPSGAYTRAKELGLLETDVLKGFQALNWVCTRPSLRREIPRKFDLPIPNGTKR